MLLVNIISHLTIIQIMIISYLLITQTEIIVQKTLI